MTVCTDQTLVSNYIGGDEQAFAEIVHRYHHSLWWAARRQVNTDHDAQDILQEALFRASRTMHMFRADCSLKTWLHRLVSNASYDFRRCRYRSAELLLIDDEAADIPQRTYDPLSALDLTLTLSNVLLRLNENQRRVLLMVDLLGFTVRRAATDLGVSIGTLKSRRSRAMQHLRAHQAELVGM
ncbi:sigma-70 family RNA polymerase sigma factor [Corynebacterium sp. H128]|uniref:sigma-70 family RNA polymerase sigma factor n=1 Tax=unclassified Corynebacterium TaxID=2624378 RepID=UPI00309FF8FA